MIRGSPSRTALAAARHRAVHQIAEQGGILADPFALRILGSDAPDAASAAQEIEQARPLRMFIALRSRFADDCVHAARARGVRQIVILGAGLDLTAFRHDLADGVTLFEVDHPDTQAWKYRLLQKAGMNPPPSLRFVPMDFEHDHLASRLAAHGFSAAAPVIFIWLGVTPYLSHDAISATLRFVTSGGSDAEIIFDYVEPTENLRDELRAWRRARADMAASFGEPWISFFSPQDMQVLLLSTGFRHIEDRSGADAAGLYGAARPREGGGGHIVRACTRVA